MSFSPVPVQLMTAAERAGYRTAIDNIRAEAARMRRAAHLIGEAPAGTPVAVAIEQRQKNQILELCARAVELCAEHAERQLPRLLN